MSCEQVLNGICGYRRNRPQCSPDCPKLAIANRLNDLTDNKVTMSFSHNVFFTSDESAMGHLWSGWLDTPSEEDFLYLDDRREESLEVQLVAELRRVGAYYNQLADEMEEKIEELATA